LILADTKFEFGTDKNGTKSTRPTAAGTGSAANYEQALESGRRPESFDKDFIGSWVSARCDPYNEPIPEIPDEMVKQTSRVYVQAYEACVGLFLRRAGEAQAVVKAKGLGEPIFLSP
jgi:phosphoribosylaminoimidazole-succinocarboxamide synthase